MESNNVRDWLFNLNMKMNLKDEQVWNVQLPSKTKLELDVNADIFAEV